MSSKKNETEKLGRDADRAVWAVEVAESIQELVLVTLKAWEGASAVELRVKVERTLEQLVAKYQRGEKQAVDQFVTAIQSKLGRELES